jgi:TolA-binding protein
MDNKQIPERRTVQKREFVDDIQSLQSSPKIFGIDRNLAIIMGLLGVSVGFSMYMFRQMTLMKEDIRSIKMEEPDSDLMDKVEENSEAVKSIELKLQQLIVALNERDKRMQQVAKMQEDEMRNQHQRQQIQQNIQEDRKIPVMGGNITHDSGETIRIE